MGPFIGLWAAQIVFGLIVLGTNPKRDDVSPKSQTYRSMAIWLGFVPCVGLMLLYQVFALIRYRGGIAYTDRQRGKLQATLETSFDTPNVRRTKDTPLQPPRAGQNKP